MKRRLILVLAGLALMACTPKPPREFDLQPDAAAETAVPPQVPDPIKRRPPYYPARAEAAQMTGSADLSVEITDAGDVSKLSVIAENPPGYDFGTAAMDAVRQWKFPPHRAGTYTVTVKFELN